ncbi:MAG TPA: hypothetical protein EYO87_17605 [Paracoccus sp.]|nr:hypothetical protein [Paracoccus sp. (in: a-proteobacteria)]
MPELKLKAGALTCVPEPRSARVCADDAAVFRFLPGETGFGANALSAAVVKEAIPIASFAPVFVADRAARTRAERGRRRRLIEVFMGWVPGC